MPLFSDLNQHNAQKFPKVHGSESIVQSMENLLVTRRGERLFEPEVGSDLEQALFEPIDADTEHFIYDLCLRPLQKWDDRVSISFAQSSVTAIPEERKYGIHLVGVDKVNGEPIVFEGELRQ